MKRFILLTIMACSIVICVSLLSKLGVPDFWGNDLIDAKLSYLLEEDHKEKYNTIFIGTSRVNNQFNPVLFDNLNSNMTKSYNLGCPGATMVETLKMTEHLIESQAGIDNILMELSAVFLPMGSNRQALESKYYIDWSECVFLVKFFYHARRNSWEKLQKAGVVFKMFLENKLNVGMYGAMIAYMTKGPSQYLIDLQKESHGYHPLYLDTQMPAEKKRRGNFLRNRDILDLRRDVANRNARKPFHGQPNPALFKKLQDLQEFANSNNIRLIYILPPRLTMTAYQQLLPVIQHWEAQDIIELYDPEKYPQFYQFNYSFDKAHLNAKGSNLLTRELSLYFKGLNQDKE